MRFVLVHSPAVGPATWRWVAEELRSGGHDAVVPDLRSDAETGQPAAVIASAAEVAGDNPYVLVGHSGAGALLPAIAASAPNLPELTVFVDAGLPTPFNDFLVTLRSLAVDEVLPPWSEWFGAGVMTHLVPDAHRRAAIERELPRVPLAFYETPNPQPVIGRAAYVWLSDAYHDDATEATRRGWRVAEVRGTHLELVNRPAEVAEALLRVADLL